MAEQAYHLKQLTVLPLPFSAIKVTPGHSQKVSASNLHRVLTYVGSMIAHALASRQCHGNVRLQLPVKHSLGWCAIDCMQVVLWVPPAAGGQELPDRHNILALRTLSNLQTFRLTGPILISRADIQSLTASWQSLKKLFLSVSLLDGTKGFEGFKGLEVLLLKPWKSSCSRMAGQAGLGGPEEGQVAIAQGITVYEQDLPEGLRELHGQDLVFKYDRSEQLPGGQGVTSGAQNPSRRRGITSLEVRYSLDSLDLQPLQLPQAGLLQGLRCLEIQHPHITGQQLAAVMAVCSSSLTRLSINTADICNQLRGALTAVPYQCTAVSDPVAATCSNNCSKTQSSNTNSGVSSRGSSSSRQTSALASSCCYAAATLGAGTFAALVAAAPISTAVGVPPTGMTVAGIAVTACFAAAAASALAGTLGLLPLTKFKSSMNQPWGVRDMIFSPVSRVAAASLCGGLLNMGCWSSHSAGSPLSSMGIGLNGGEGLAVLRYCTQLEELHLVIGDKVLGPTSRAAISNLPKLRKLTVAVASNWPATAARDLGAWVPGLRQLESVGLGNEGPEAGEVLQGLVERVSRGLPACQVSMLKPCAA